MSQEQQNQIELPQHMPNNGEHKRILGEFYDTYKNKQWFRRAELISNHPTHMKPTLEIHCNYTPVLEMKDIIPFFTKYNLGMEIISRSHQD